MLLKSVISKIAVFQFRYYDLYTKTSEILGELSRETWHRSPLLWLHNNSYFRSESDMIWYFIDVSIHDRLEIRNFASHVSLLMVFFNTREEISYLRTAM